MKAEGRWVDAPHPVSPLRSWEAVSSVEKEKLEAGPESQAGGRSVLSEKVGSRDIEGESEQPPSLCSRVHLHLAALVVRV